MKKLILASASPYRADILRGLGYDFKVHCLDIEEIWHRNLPIEEGVEDIAKQKAEAAYGLFPNYPILTADTVVVSEKNLVLFKPRSFHEAATFMKQRSGSSERVITAFCFRYGEEVYLDSDTSFIKYKKIPPKMQEEILQKDNWRDVCGGLKIEGQIAPYIKEIKGSHNNIRGLPIEKLLPLLEKFQIMRREL